MSRKSNPKHNLYTLTPLRICKKCNKSEEESPFYRRYKSTCAFCENKRRRAKRKTNNKNEADRRASLRAAGKCFNHINRQSVIRGKCEECRRYSNSSRIRRQYGITLQKYEEIMKQGYCDVCNATNLKLHLDHDHKTKAIRGVLCYRCNHALGNAQDSPIVLRKLADYIEQCGEIVGS